MRELDNLVSHSTIYNKRSFTSLAVKDMNTHDD
jgi:hypothetical protein